MIAIADRTPLSAQDYLIWEEQQPIKYEYFHGEVHAMTGGTLPHNDIAVNLTTALKLHLSGTGCKVRMSDAKVGITESGPFFYPDVLVTCDERDRRALKIVRHPCLIIEVLSPTTEGFDRGEKFRHYRRLDSLTEYVLVNTDLMGVECYRLNDRQKWELTAYIAEAELGWSLDAAIVEFTSIQFQSSLSVIYDDVDLNLHEG